VQFDHRFDTHNASTQIPRNLLSQVGKKIDFFLPVIASFLRQLPSSIIGLYGAGELTKRFLNEKAESIRKHKVVLIETSAQDTEFLGFQKISVDRIGEVHLDRVIIMSLQYEDQMLAALSQYFTKKIDTIGSILNHVDLTTRRSLLQKFIRTIITDQYLEKIDKACRRNKKIIAFVTPILHMKYLKLLRSLKENGFGVVLIVEKEYVSMDFGYMLDEFSKKYFDLYCAFQQYFDLFAIELLNSGRFYLAHMITSTAGTRKLANIVVNADCPVVTEYDDFIEVCFSNDEKYLKYVPMVDSNIALERQAFQAIFCQSSGIIQRHSPELIDILSKKHNCEPKWISFAPYPAKNKLKKKLPLLKPGTTQKSIRIVSAVGIPNNPEAPNFSRTHSLFYVGKVLAAQGIEFTIYNLLDRDGKGFEQIIEFSRNNSLFNYCFAVPHDHLIEEICQYDWGWHCMDFNSSDKMMEYISRGVGSKHYAYIEAGLPIIISKEIAYDYKSIESAGIGIGLTYADIYDLKSVINRLNYNLILENVARYQEKWCLENQLPRLLSFNEEVIYNYYGTAPN
jgi:hypothetical protein